MLDRKVPGKNASLEEIEAFQRETDLKNLPGFGTYEKESQFTTEWYCPNCGGPIPCTINCPQCGHRRPRANADPDQEGHMGENRRRAGYRP